MTGREASSAKGIQLAAIEASGWGEPFRFFQPRNLAFWVYLTGISLGTVNLIQYYVGGSAFYHPVLFAGILLFGIYLLPWLLYLRRQNRYTAQPAKLLLAAFGWGATAATFWIAISANTNQLEYWAKLFGPDWSSSWGIGIAASIDEEIAKGLGLLLLVGMAPRLIRGAYDGFIVGAFVGLGFQISEDVLYAYQGGMANFGVGQANIAWETFLVRGVTGFFTHALFSAIFCAGIMWILGRTRGERRILGGLLAVFLGLLFHFVFDDIGVLTGGDPIYGLLLQLGLFISEVVTLVVVRRLASRQERLWISDVLAPEYQAGVVDGPLLAAFAGLRRDRRRYRKLLHSRRRARRLITAVGDLAREIAHSHAAETNRVAFARREVIRLRSPYPGWSPPPVPTGPGPVRATYPAGPAHGQLAVRSGQQ